VQAGGALMKFVEKLRIGVELEHQDIGVPLLEVKIFSV
jgi:hypothetical protein